MSSIKHVAIYGKGGIGKSCTASNIAAACAEEGHRVLVVGCDPKSDSSITLVGRRIPTMMDLILAGGDIQEKDVVFQGYKGVKCIEVGGPEPGVGCAGRGIIVAIDFLRKVSKAMENVDLVLYDVPGDIVCGGFSAPIRKGLVSQAYIITSGEYMPLYAANNISKGLRRLKTPTGRRDLQLARGCRRAGEGDCGEICSGAEQPTGGLHPQRPNSAAVREESGDGDRGRAGLRDRRGLPGPGQGDHVGSRAKGAAATER